MHVETDKVPFSLAALIKLHVSLKLEKDFTLTDRQKVFGRAGCRCRSVKVKGMLIFLE